LSQNIFVHDERKPISQQSILDRQVEEIGAREKEKKEENIQN
jgi:hypothetical protein